MKKRVRGTGRAWQRKAGGWTIAYYVNGVEQRESVASALNKPPAAVTEREAHTLLTERLAAIGRGVPVAAAAGRMTVADAIENWYAHLVERKAKSLKPAASRRKHLRALLGDVRITQLTPELVRQRYTAARREAGVTDGTIHSELLSLTGALNLLHKEGRLTHVPFIPKPPAPPARQNYPEPEVLAAILLHVLHDASRDSVEYADATGRRKSEVLGLTWAQVFLRDGEIRMDETKNGMPVTIAISADVAPIIERRVKARQLDSPYVFHDHGRPIGPKTVLSRLKRASIAAGFAHPKVDKRGAPVTDRRGRPVLAADYVFHDLRRSGVRNLIRGGASKSVAKSISGHRDDSVFDRYNITSTEDQRSALQGVAAYRAKRLADSSRTVAGIS